MKRTTTQRRLFINQWYIGSGNRISVFTRRAKRPFEEIKELYLMEIESSKVTSTTIRELSIEQKRLIKERVKKQIRKQNNTELLKSGISILLSVGILIGLIFLAKYLIDYFKEYM